MGDEKREKVNIKWLAQRDELKRGKEWERNREDSWKVGEKWTGEESKSGER